MKHKQCMRLTQYVTDIKAEVGEDKKIYTNKPEKDTGLSSFYCQSIRFIDWDVQRMSTTVTKRKLIQ